MGYLIKPSLQPAINSLASRVPSLSVSELSKSAVQGANLSWEMVAPFGDTAVQAASHLAPLMPSGLG